MSASNKPGKRSRSSSTWDRLREAKRNDLTRERIVAAGIGLADKHGLPAVSIRRIAAELGSSPMALYHYVPSKRDLLNLILDALSAEFEYPDRPFKDWRSTLVHFARETRRSLKLHPWASALRAADPEYGPECIRTLEYLLGGLCGFGFDIRTATRALGVLFVFVNGFVAVETGQAAVASRKNGGQLVPARFSSAVLETGNFPNVARFVAIGAELPDDEGFERALKWILDGIEADLPARFAGPRMNRTVNRQKRSA
ncbi:MAG TPA: TetR/AcrR family transcriptional regulator [Bryobacteraceae bacterium]|nr:TetR/AcrR family transcriptional regulator [Bryobacteraceae bacterium]